MKILSLDLSTSRTGYAFFNDEDLVEYGAISPERYTGCHLDRYPKKTIMNCRSIAVSLRKLCFKHDPDIILIEEVNPNKRSGVKSIKSLAMLHGIIMAIFKMKWLNSTQIMTSSEWRSIIGLKKGVDWKSSCLEYVNMAYSLGLNYDENDEADAIAMAHAYILKSQRR